MSALSNALAEVKGGRSINDVVDAAARAGHRISRAQVAAYVNGSHGRPKESTLQALAAGLGMEVGQLRVLAGRPDPGLGPYVPTVEAVSLTREQRAAIDQLIKTIIHRVRRDEPWQHHEPTESFVSGNGQT